MTTIDIPAGLAGVVVADTAIGDVRGEEGFYHYRQYSAVELAQRRSLEDVWHLLFVGSLPADRSASADFAARVAALRELPPELAALLPQLATPGDPLGVLRTAVSALGAELGWQPTLDLGHAQIFEQGLRLCAVIPTILAATYRIAHGQAAIAPRTDLGHAANYLWMLTGKEPDPAHARAIEQYLITTIDHGFNSSAFTARVITSTGADLAAATCGAIGALSGPLHGGAPSRALDMLDAIGQPENTEPYVRHIVESDGRIMGFGHRVYKTEDPRAALLRDVALDLGGDLGPFAVRVEETVVRVLAELKPGRHLYANVEFYAGPVMATCGLPREMFTPTFAASRAIGWTAHVLEQADHNKLIRPSARYVGPPPPEPVPTLT
jgi:citrate synthase